MSPKSINIFSIVIVVLIIICVVWVLLRETTYKSQYSTSVSTEEVTDIQRVVKGYYVTYSTSLNRIRELSEPSVNIATYDQDGRITDNFIKDQGDIFVLDKVSGEIGENSVSSDPILCARDDVQVSGVEVLDIVSTSTPSALSLRALSRVSFIADGSKKDTGYYAEVGLVKTRDQWLIDTIECKSRFDQEILSQLQKLPEIKSLMVDTGSFEITDFIRSDISATTSLVLAGGRDSAFYNDTSYLYKVSRNGTSVSVNRIPLVGTQNDVKEYLGDDHESVYEDNTMYDGSLTTAYFEGRKLKVLGMRPFRTYPCNLIRTFEYYNNRMIETLVGQSDFCKKYKIDVPKDMDKIPESVAENSVVKEVYKISPETLQKALKFNGFKPRSKIDSESESVYVSNTNDKIIATSGDWSIILRIEGQIGGALLVQIDNKGVQKIIAVDEDINHMIEKFVPADAAQNLKKILQDREAKDREVNSAKKKRGRQEHPRNSKG